MFFQVEMKCGICRELQRRKQHGNPRKTYKSGKRTLNVTRMISPIRDWSSFTSHLL